MFSRSLLSWLNFTKTFWFHYFICMYIQNIFLALVSIDMHFMAYLWHTLIPLFLHVQNMKEWNMFTCIRVFESKDPEETAVLGSAVENSFTVERNGLIGE